MGRPTASATTRGLGAVLAVGLFVAACGDDDPGVSDGATASVTEAPAVTETPIGTEAADAGYSHPTGADEVVVQYTDVLGFPMFVRGFQSPPSALMSGAGEYISPAAVAAVFPGPLVPPFETRTVTDQGIQTVLAAADEAGLLAAVDYGVNPQIADANTASVIVVADGQEFRHDANALFVGADPVGGESPYTAEEQAAREALSGFIEQFLAIEDLVGPDEVGASSPYEADAYLMAVLSTEQSPPGTTSPDAEVVPWPADTGIVLAEVDGCIEAAADAVGDTFETADELTLFDEDGIVYQVAPIQKLPGRTC